MPRIPGYGELHHVTGNVRRLRPSSTNAAVERADELIAAATTTVAPADYFDGLLAALDEPDHAPRLAKAAKRSRRVPRIAAR